MWLSLALVLIFFYAIRIKRNRYLSFLYHLFKNDLPDNGELGLNSIPENEWGDLTEYIIMTWPQKDKNDDGSGRCGVA